MARKFYEAETLRGGWTVRQLDRQIDSLYYERIALSKNKAAMLTKGQKPVAGDALAPEEEIKDPFVIGNLPNKVLAAEYKLGLPDEDILVAEIERTRRLLEGRNRFTQMRRTK